MRRIVSSFLILFLVITMTACGNKEAEESQVFKKEKDNLSLENVIELSIKGNELSWKDFKIYDSTDIGSGLYIQHYDIDEKYYLLIGGGSIDEKPMYIRLVKANNSDDYIDIRTDDIDEFISE
ncbi:hypothetical protein EJP82_08410 [Paenibacillus anaericanus]|uniref:Uncharacterized protein n=1 Tax=Paenibacillus anaericanus TaxID=170367 RepID=A0A3S1BQH2_9BACL|nr:hypothetical protein [Paenibacillus anaericanus]RUT47190.1 hypothetical protein EJP82_08410 [Paenibacillus anaericanus]